MFNKDFYPTPEHVILEMIGDLNLQNKIVYEPQGGKGDIIKFCKKRGAKVIASELNEDLAIITAKHADEFIGNDFFKIKAEQISHIDFIIMNPPFSNADKHILHAWKIAPPGCHIISLANYKTVSVNYSRYREKICSIIDGNGNYIKYENFFKNAERKTNVKIALINLYKPNNEQETEFSGFFSLDDDKVGKEPGLMPYNEIRNIVQRFVDCCQQYKGIIDVAKKLNSSSSFFCYSDLRLEVSRKSGIIEYNQFKKTLQKSAWEKVLSKLNMERFVTKSLLSELNKFVEKQANVPFTVKNVYKMVEIIAGTHGDRMKKVLVEVFDNLTKHHKDNRFHVEGWATNSHYCVKQKFIKCGQFRVDHCWKTSKAVMKGNYYDSRYGNDLDDLVKALCWFKGLPYNSDQRKSTQEKDAYGKNKTVFVMGNLRNTIDHKSPDFGQWFDFYDMFEIKGYKKGTAHVKFKHKEDWEFLNRKVAEIKGYPLPENVYGFDSKRNDFYKTKKAKTKKSPVKKEVVQKEVVQNDPPALKAAIANIEKEKAVVPTPVAPKKQPVKKQQIPVLKYDSNSFDSVYAAFCASFPINSVNAMNEGVKGLRIAYNDSDDFWDDDFENFDLAGYMDSLAVAA